MSGRSSSSQQTSTTTVLGMSRRPGKARNSAAQRTWWASERSMAATTGPVSSKVAGEGSTPTGRSNGPLMSPTAPRRALQPLPDDLVVAFGQVATP